MKKIILAFLSVIFIQTAFSQKPAQAMYFELGGPGLASINFDTRFSKKEDGIGGRIGFGGFSIDGSGSIFVPVGLTYLIGKDGKNYFEIGGGFTYVNSFDNNDDGFDDNDGTFSSTFGHLTFGYRLQPVNGGFFFRAGINPVFGKGFFVPYLPGVSFGYKFGSSK